MVDCIITPYLLGFDGLLLYRDYRNDAKDASSLARVQYVKMARVASRRVSDVLGPAGWKARLQAGLPAQSLLYAYTEAHRFQSLVLAVADRRLSG